MVDHVGAVVEAASGGSCRKASRTHLTTGWRTVDLPESQTVAS